MHALQFLLIVAGFTSTLTAPADPSQQIIPAAVKEAFEPVQEHVRAAFDNTKKAIEDLGAEAKKSKDNILEAVRSAVKPVENMDRANLGGEYKLRAANVMNAVEENAKNLLNRAVQDSKPILESERSALFSARDALNLIEKKYLTDDGQALVKTVLNLATKH